MTTTLTLPDGFARTTEGRAEAGRLVSMVRALRAEH